MPNRLQPRKPSSKQPALQPTTPPTTLPGVPRDPYTQPPVWIHPRTAGYRSQPASPVASQYQ